MFTWLDELASWWAALPPEWMFLMLLPFGVAAAGLLVHWPMGARHSNSRKAKQDKPRGRRRFL
jgi:hypothetical protein